MTFSTVIESAVELSRHADQAHDEASIEKVVSSLEAFLQSLTAAEVFMLTTIMYLGRDGGGAAGLIDRYQKMSDTFESPSRAITQMLNKIGRLHDYWQAGRQTLTAANIDLDTLLTTHIDSPLALLNDSDEIDLDVGPWYCDRCGQIIDEPENGVLQWLTRLEGEREVGRNLSVVHHLAASPLGGRYGCYADERRERAADGSMVNDLPLDHMIDWDGLVILLSMSADGRFSAGEVNRMVMRLFVPGYEQARPYFRKALETGVVESDLPQDYFYQGDLQQIIANIPRMEK